MQSFELSNLKHALPSDEALALQIAEAVESAIDLSPAVDEAMNRDASSPHMQATLVEQVQELCTSAIEVNKSFISVKNGLQLIESNQAFSQNKGNFVSKWSELQERWKALLLRSRRTATRAEAYIKDFIDVIIPMARDVNNLDDLKECQKELADFMKQNEEDKPTYDTTGQIPAQEHSDNYAKLKEDVGMFKNKFISHIPVSELEKVKEELREVESKVTCLENTHSPGENVSLIDEIQRCVDLLQRFSRYIEKINVQACSIALGIFAPIFKVSPSDVRTAVTIAGAAGLIIMGGLLLFKHYRSQGAAEQRERIREEEIGRLRHRQERLRQQIRDLSQLKEQMNSQTPNMSDIYISLEGFEAVWAIVQHDADIIGHNLDNILSTSESSLSKIAFKRRMDMIQANNESLAKALSEFATISNGTGERSSL